MLIFSNWIGFLLSGLICYGSTFGAVMLGLMFATHVGSVLDVVRPRLDRAPLQAVVRGCMAAALLLVLYIPPARVMAHFVDAQQWLQTAEPFQAGDVVLFNPRAYVGNDPKPGDIVVFEAEGARYMDGRLMWHGYGEPVGRSVERILAGPGSKVAWKGNELWIDGHRSNSRPLMEMNNYDQPELLVPPGMYYILPAATIRGQPGRALPTNFVLYPRGSIVGRAIVRHYPIWRWWWFN